ncbi:MAG: hypothetical protein PHW74_00330 [Desulfobacca sp.]|nr:hypothetical protein [Desulfobacca sp.]
MNTELKAKIIQKFGRQFVFGRACGIREDRISRFIYGRATPTPEEKAIIAKMLQVQESEIFPEAS